MRYFRSGVTLFARVFPGRKKNKRKKTKYFKGLSREGALRSEEELGILVGLSGYEDEC